MLMGYRREPPRLKLKFADGEYEGLEVFMRPLSVDRFLRITGLSATLKDTAGGGDVAGAVAKAGELFGEFAGGLAGWNLEDGDGQPVPATRAGVGAQDLGFVLDIVAAWTEAVAGVDIPLPPGSNGGPRPGLEASLPMAPLSPNLAS